MSPARARPSTSRSTVLPSKPVGTDRFQNPELFRFQTDRKARVHVLSNPSPTSIGSVWDDSPAPLQEPCHSRGNSTVIGISNNCKCLHILLALVLLPHKFATNQGKDLVFRDFFLDWGIVDEGLWTCKQVCIYSHHPLKWKHSAGHLAFFPLSLSYLGTEKDPNSLDHCMVLRHVDEHFWLSPVFCYYKCM